MLAIATELDLKTPRVQVKRPQKRINEPDNEDSEEFWKRGPSRRKPRSTYQEGKRLKRMTEDHALKALPFNPNHTIANPNFYYYRNPVRNFFVASLRSHEDTAPNITIRSDDYDTLFDKNWLMNTIIDCWASTLIRTSQQPNIALVSCELSKYLVTGEGTDGKPLPSNFHHRFRDAWTGKSGILLPQNIRNAHWVLMYADIENSTIYWLDPSTATMSRAGKTRCKMFITGYQKVKLLQPIDNTIVKW